MTAAVPRRVARPPVVATRGVVSTRENRMEAQPTGNRIERELRAPDHPLELLRAWLAEAERSEPNEPNAMALATVGPDGAPSVRMVLLKGFDEAGFVFYTNLDSRKGRQLALNPQAALLFHGRFELEREVARYTARFHIGAIPRPPFWSGFRLKPRRIEFWREGAFRLHDRLVYHSGEHGWTTERLFP
jgi:pyridoxamine 5'-phosphate oxidase